MVISVHPITTEAERAIAAHPLPEGCLYEPAKGRPNGAVLIRWESDPEASDEFESWVIRMANLGLITFEESGRLVAGLYERTTRGRRAAQRQAILAEQARQEAVCHHANLDPISFVAYKCESCHEISVEAWPLRECPHCDLVFASQDRVCPQCNRPFTRNLDAEGCPGCEHGEVVEIEANECVDCGRFVEVQA